MKFFKRRSLCNFSAIGVAAIIGLGVNVGYTNILWAQAVPGGTLDPLTIPKYVTPLVIPPVMNNTGTANDYDIAVRQFKQQILPGGIWNSINGRNDTYPATTVWSYGPAADPTPTVAPAANSQFNYPAYTIENVVNAQTTVDWINDLVANPAVCRTSSTPATDPACNFLPHLTPVDQTLHWANPAKDCLVGNPRTDCRGKNQAPYAGPVPIVTHVHGAHVGPESDGYPEAWWLPAANNIPQSYATSGTLVNRYATQTNTNPGIAHFTYPNTQPSTTLWYHDHTLGMTRNNVYAGPAGFWLIRPSAGGETGLTNGRLPRPAPVAGDTVLELNAPNLVAGTTDKRAGIREIPIVIQDRSFNCVDVQRTPVLCGPNPVGVELFYPANRAFFEGLGDGQRASTIGNVAAGLDIPFIPGDARGPSDISPIWNPEAFFNVMVVNGVSWPTLEVAPALYRFRLLNGSNSRFLNLALFQVNVSRRGSTISSREVPFFQIGAEQSLLPQVVMIQTGFATKLTFNNPIPTNTRQMTKAAHKNQALLLGLAERADVIVDFRGLPNGTRIRMINTGPDAPFGGFPVVPADPRTTGQVMEFVVNSALNGKSPTDPVLADGVTTNPNAASAPNQLQLSPVENVDTYSPPTTAPLRDLALLEEASKSVCVKISPRGTITYVDLPTGTEPFDPLDPANACFAAGGVPFAPQAAVLGINGSAGAPGPGGTGAQVTMWSDGITTNPSLNAVEAWELWNWSADAHPIHLHLVKFKVMGRRGVLPATPSLIPVNGVQPWEIGWKDTVIAYPGEVTTVAATFDIRGLYVWHCHIVEHEDNEMMVPYCVGTTTANGCQAVP